MSKLLQNKFKVQGSVAIAVEKKMQEQINGQKDIVDMLISNQVSLDEVLEPIPEFRVAFERESSAEELTSKIEETTRKYLGEPQQEIEVYKDGFLRSSYRFLKQKLFGGNIVEVVSETHGLQGFGEELLAESKEEISSIKREFEQVQLSLQRKKNYLQSLERNLDDHKGLYLKFVSRKQQIDSLQDDLEQRVGKENLSGQEATASLQVKNEADHKSQLVHIKMMSVGARIEEYHAQVTYLREEILMNTKNLNAAEVNLYKLEAMLQSIGMRLQTQSSFQRLHTVMLSVESLQRQVKGYQDQMHGVILEQAEYSTSLARRDPQLLSYNNEQLYEIKNSKSDLIEASELRDEQRHNRIMSIIYKSEDANAN